MKAPKHRWLAIAICCRVVACLTVWTSVGRSADSGEPSPEAVLQEHGLSKVGKLWILPEEQELRDRLATLERFEKRHREARASVEQLLDANEATFARLSKLEESAEKTRELAAAAKAGTAQRKQLDAEQKNADAAVEQLRKVYIPPEKLGMGPPLKTALMDLVNARTDATLKLLAYRDTPDDLPQRYERLGKDPAIAAALAALPTPGQLGPLKGLKDTWRLFVDKLDSNLLGNTLPIYREGRAIRLTAIVDDRRPLTFTFGNAGESTVIAQNLAETAGLAVGPDARKVKYHIAEGRDVMAQIAKIAQLRIGRRVWKNVEFYILPPEAADVGARISPNSLPGYHLTINPSRFQLTIENSAGR
ncbi:MAG TPA: retropepsin-like aspartic protease [Pirellulales bacterium]|jgi:hypothetical protein|nr:retropepsin-like aspartic protease [Pirellulales bacterium]